MDKADNLPQKSDTLPKENKNFKYEQKEIPGFFFVHKHFGDQNLTVGSL